MHGNNSNQNQFTDLYGWVLHLKSRPSSLWWELIHTLNHRRSTWREYWPQTLQHKHQPFLYDGVTPKEFRFDRTSFSVDLVANAICLSLKPCFLTSLKSSFVRWDKLLAIRYCSTSTSSLCWVRNHLSTKLSSWIS